MGMPEERNEQLERKSVTVEGNIASGKSHLTRKLKEVFGGKALTCDEPVNTPLLELFYKDKKKYGFTLQISMLNTRSYQAELARLYHIQTKGTPFWFLWDRSTLGDYCFAAWNHLNKNISSSEMNVYEKLAGGSLLDVLKINGVPRMSRILLLDDDPAHCKQRCEEVRKNPEEFGIPLSYYEGLDDMHFTIFMQLFQLRPGAVDVMVWSDYEDTAKVTARLSAHPTSSVKQIQGDLEDVPHDAIVYSTREQILEAYTAFKEGRARTAKNIYLPSNIMTVAPETKITRLNHRYTGLTFYENEYKRVAMRHLSTGCTVHVYSI